MDITGAEELIALDEELRAAEVKVWLARLHGSAAATAQKTGVIDAVGADRLLPSVRALRDAARVEGLSWDEPPPASPDRSRPT